MADNFNLAKFLRNNQLLNEGIGGYKDVVPYAGPEKKLDGFGDEFDQVDPVEEMDGSMTGDKGWQYDDEDGIDDPDADIVNDFVQGMRPYYEKDPSFIKRVIDAIRGKGFGAKMYDAGFRMNEAEEEDAYFDYKNNRRSFLPEPDEFQDAIDSSEMSGHDFMMGLAHNEFGSVSDIVKKTIEGLRAGGFDDQDIIDFLATDFSSEEGLNEAEMYTVDFGTNTQDFELDREAGVLKGLKPQRGLPGSPREEDIIPVKISDEGFLSTSDPRVKEISPKSNANPFSDPGYMNRD